MGSEATPPQSARFRGSLKGEGAGSRRCRIPAVFACSSSSPLLPSFAMLSVRTPLATIADQQQLQLSPLKRLTLADKENTVRATRVPAELDVHWQVLGYPGGWRVPTAIHHACLPTAPNPQQHPRPGQQGCEENLPGLHRAGEWPV